MPTSGAGDGTNLAREAIVQGADLILVLGGDGTVNEVIQAMAHTGIPMGVLPGGTANVLAMELGLGSRPEVAAERIATSQPRAIALGRVNGAKLGSRYFLLMCGAGLDAMVVYHVSPGLKAVAGKLAYWLAGFGHFFRSVGQLEVRLDGQVYPCGFALVSRVANYGGDLEIASGASLTRDDFEVVLFEGSNSLRYAWYMLGVAARRVHTMRGVRVMPAHRVEILSDAPAQIDGEYLGRQSLCIEIVPGAMNLLLPPGHG